MSIKLPIRKCAFAVSSVRELNGPEVNEGCAHLPCLGSAISLCLEHWQPLGGISILPEKSRYLLLLVHGKTDAHKSLQTSENSACVFVEPIVK